MRPKPTDNNGFTLLEVMIALAIVGGGMMVLLTLGSQSIKTHDRIQNVTRGMLLAQKTMSEIEVKTKAGQMPALGGEQYEEPYDDFRWHGETEDTPIPMVSLVTVTVAWGEEADEQFELTSFLAQK